MQVFFSKKILHSAIYGAIAGVMTKEAVIKKVLNASVSNKIRSEKRSVQKNVGLASSC